MADRSNFLAKVKDNTENQWVELDDPLPEGHSVKFSDRNKIFIRETRKDKRYVKSIGYQTIRQSRATGHRAAA